ncbi:ClbS/DfsB family four-helix bundle protein, partial [Rhodovulum sulfidophilum]
RTASMEGHAAGTMMSPADLVAYLLGWNELVLKWLDRDDRGEAVEFPETGFKWNQLGSLAQKFYADYQHLDWHELLPAQHARDHRRPGFLAMPQGHPASAATRQLAVRQGHAGQGRKRSH